MLLESLTFPNHKLPHICNNTIIIPRTNPPVKPPSPRSCLSSPNSSSPNTAAAGACANPASPSYSTPCTSGGLYQQSVGSPHPPSVSSPYSHFPSFSSPHPPNFGSPHHPSVRSPRSLSVGSPHPPGIVSSHAPGVGSAYPPSGSTTPERASSFTGSRDESPVAATATTHTPRSTDSEQFDAYLTSAEIAVVAALETRATAQLATTKLSLPEDNTIVVSPLEDQGDVSVPEKTPTTDGLGVVGVGKFPGKPLSSDGGSRISIENITELELDVQHSLKPSALCQQSGKSGVRNRSLNSCRCIEVCNNR